ncbi:MraY family glycosyltransferase [Leptolyngbya iicbica]|uniref:Glycosyltransferase family 4 protein n=2 Tax=Cyanophyceae TaxID=3028117 RepID=A0A4Q7EGF2_9CYAN|nr:glycosyltransferase family 4 protein [Leptolyngbya sp. LK]RZM82352.1 glycosyltransferase family 4 protein [Leptolyngbya sp. LK]
MIGVLLSIGFSGVAAWALTGWLRQRFQQTLLDIPNDRSSHTQPTPRGGGLGFFIAFLGSALGAWLGQQFWPTLFAPLFPPVLAVAAVILPLAIVGMLDDRYNLSAKIRYAVQLGAAAIALFSFGLWPQPWLTLTPVTDILLGGVTLFGFTALVNFYNFMDGLDGLVASVTAAQLAFLAVYLQQPLWWLMVAALLGFLGWNWSPAKIFMGDVGSTVLGACVAIALIAPTVDPTRSFGAIAITLPLTADAIYTLSRRLLKGENIFQAHRTHLYQRLQQSGWSHRQVAGAYLGFTAIVAGLIGFGQGIGSLVAVGLSGALIFLGERYLHQRARLSESTSS